MMYQHCGIKQLTTSAAVNIAEHRGQHDRGDGNNLEYNRRSQYEAVHFKLMSESGQVTGDDHNHEQRALEEKISAYQEFLIDMHIQPRTSILAHIMTGYLPDYSVIGFRQYS
jgi:hypothetical protein